MIRLEPVAAHAEVVEEQRQHAERREREERIAAQQPGAGERDTEQDRGERRQHPPELPGAVAEHVRDRRPCRLQVERVRQRIPVVERSEGHHRRQADREHRRALGSRAPGAAALERREARGSSRTPRRRRGGAARRGRAAPRPRATAPSPRAARAPRARAHPAGRRSPGRRRSPGATRSRAARRARRHRPRAGAPARRPPRARARAAARARGSRAGARDSRAGRADSRATRRRAARAARPSRA